MRFSVYYAQDFTEDVFESTRSWISASGEITSQHEIAACDGIQPFFHYWKAIEAAIAVTETTRVRLGRCWVLPTIRNISGYLLGHVNWCTPIRLIPVTTTSRHSHLLDLC